jgi:hypothetical protein
MRRVRDFGRIGVLVLLSWACSALPAAAQGFGATGGTIMDSSSGVLPGVAVTLSSAQGTVGSNQQTTSDERGTYQFLRLVPGTYIVRAELQGFRPAEQRNIVVNADVTARADLKMEIGTMAEGVTVTGESPLLDTSNAMKQTVLSHEFLNSLPNKFDLWSLAKVQPGIVLSKVDVGGSEAFQQSGITVRGTSNENGYFIDGMDVGQLDGSGVGTIFFADPYAFQEVNLQTGGSGAAAMARGGLVYNMITRTGTNRVHGEALISGSTPSMDFPNFSPTLKSQLLATVPASVLAVNPNLSPGAKVNRSVDYGAWISGPIKTDKLWYSYSYHNKVLNQYIAGNYNPDGTQVLDDNSVWTTSGKVAWQVTKAAQIAYTNNNQHRIVGHRNDSGGTFASSQARNINDKYPDAHQVKFTTPWRAKMVLDLSYNRFRAADRFRPTAGTASDAIARVETTSNTATDAAPNYNVKPQFRDQFQVSANYFAGPHDLVLGYQIVESAATMQQYSLSGMRIQYTNGVPVSVNTYNVPIGSTGVYDRAGHITNVAERYHAYDRLQNIYFQDKWTATKKLVLNLGVRFSKDVGWMPATCRTQTIFVDQQCYPAIKNAPNLTNVVGRFSAIYDVAGDGRTALKFGANRYNVPIVLSYVQRLNPVGLASDSRVWTVCAAGQTSSCDLNRDGTPQLNELGVSTGFGGGVNSRYGDVKVPLADEYTAEIQRQLPGNVVATVGYVYRKKINTLVQRNVAVPKDTYIPLTVTERNSGQAVTVYNQAPSLRGQIDNLFSSDPLGNTVYNGADITFNKRMSNRWSVLGGGSFGKTTGDPVMGDLNNPNNDAYRDGIVGNDTPWSYRLSGVYELPYQVAVSGTAQYYAGFPEQKTVLVNSATLALTQSSQTLNVSQRGDTRLPNVFELDMSFRRSFKLPGKTFEPRIDIYNVTNASTILGRVNQLGSAYGRASTIMRGRLIRLGGSVTF